MIINLDVTPPWKTLSYVTAIHSLAYLNEKKFQCSAMGNQIE